MQEPKGVERVSLGAQLPDPPLDDVYVAAQVAEVFREGLPHCFAVALGEPGRRPMRFLPGGEHFRHTGGSGGVHQWELAKEPVVRETERAPGYGPAQQSAEVELLGEEEVPNVLDHRPIPIRFAGGELAFVAPGK